jgi:hypothetical protein
MKEMLLIDRAVAECEYMREVLDYALSKLREPPWDSPEADDTFPMAYEAAKAVVLGLERLDSLLSILGELRRLYRVERLEKGGEGR